MDGMSGVDSRVGSDKDTIVDQMDIDDASSSSDHNSLHKFKMQ